MLTCGARRTIAAPSCEATQPPTPMTSPGRRAFSSRQNPSWVKTFSCAFSRTEQVLSSNTSASAGSSVNSRPWEAASTSAMRAESYSFIWQPKGLMCSLRGINLKTAIASADYADFRRFWEGEKGVYRISAGWEIPAWAPRRAPDQRRGFLPLNCGTIAITSAATDSRKMRPKFSSTRVYAIAAIASSDGAPIHNPSFNIASLQAESGAGRGSRPIHPEHPAEISIPQSGRPRANHKAKPMQGGTAEMIGEPLAARRRRLAACKWWLWVDSNHRPHHYECRALTS